MEIKRYSAIEQGGVPLKAPEDGVFTVEHIIRLLEGAGVFGAEIIADPLAVTDITPPYWTASAARYWLSRPDEGGPVRVELMPAGDGPTMVRNVNVTGQTGEEFDMTRTPLRTVTVPGPEGPFVLTGPNPSAPNAPYIHELIVPAP